MIESFACRKTERLWRDRAQGRFPPDLAIRALAKLAQLDHAMCLADLTIPPSNHLEALKGDRRGQHSIRVNQQWRLCFRWDNGVHDCELVDYH